jgi:hypothetical protein
MLSAMSVMTDLGGVGIEVATSKALQVLIVENLEGGGVLGHLCECARELGRGVLLKYGM